MPLNKGDIIAGKTSKGSVYFVGIVMDVYDGILRNPYEHRMKIYVLWHIEPSLNYGVHRSVIISKRNVEVIDVDNEDHRLALKKEMDKTTIDWNA